MITARTATPHNGTKRVALVVVSLLVIIGFTSQTTIDSAFGKAKSAVGAAVSEASGLASDAKGNFTQCMVIAFFFRMLLRECFLTSSCFCFPSFLDAAINAGIHHGMKSD